MTSERRRHSRVQVQILARGPHGPASPCRVVEMTLEGLTLKMPRPVKAGAECALTLEGGLRCRGKVVHSRRSGEETHVGIQILDAAPVEKFKLFRYIQKRKEQIQ